MELDCNPGFHQIFLQSINNNNSMKPRVAVYIPWIIYIYLIYIYLSIIIIIII